MELANLCTGKGSIYISTFYDTTNHKQYLSKWKLLKQHCYIEIEGLREIVDNDQIVFVERAARLDKLKHISICGKLPYDLDARSQRILIPTGISD